MLPVLGAVRRSPSQGQKSLSKLEYGSSSTEATHPPDTTKVRFDTFMMMVQAQVREECDITQATPVSSPGHEATQQQHSSNDSSICMFSASHTSVARYAST